MKKYILYTVIAAVLMCSSVFAAGITYDGEPITFTDQTPIIINERTYVPIRDVFEKLGFQVEWIPTTKRVKLTDNKYILDINTTTNILSIYEKDTKATHSFELTDKPVLVGGRTLLPLREILESINYELEWDGVSKTTNIKHS